MVAFWRLLASRLNVACLLACRLLRNVHENVTACVAAGPRAVCSLPHSGALQRRCCTAFASPIFKTAALCVQAPKPFAWAATAAPTCQPACLPACLPAAGYVWEFSMLDTPHELEMQEGLATGSSQASLADMGLSPLPLHSALGGCDSSCAMPWQLIFAMLFLCVPLHIPATCRSMLWMLLTSRRGSRRRWRARSRCRCRCFPTSAPYEFRTLSRWVGAGRLSCSQLVLEWNAKSWINGAPCINRRQLEACPNTAPQQPSLHMFTVRRCLPACLPARASAGHLGGRGRHLYRRGQQRRAGARRHRPRAPGGPRPRAPAHGGRQVAAARPPRHEPHL